MNIQSAISSLFLGMSLVSCSSTFIEQNKPAENKVADTNSIESKLYHSGGVPNERELCPKSPFDTITPVSSLNPPPAEGTPEMTIEGIFEFIQENNITTMEELLNTFPDHYRTYFSLVEHTRAAGQSNLEAPRIVLYGPDGRFMANVGTKTDDPLYNKLDVAELNTTTGRWEFSVFDFTTEKPSLIRNDESCIECHGDLNSRPSWGDFQEWTGVFGDSIIDGPRPEALDHTHAIKMNKIMSGKGGNPRFDFLLWKPQSMRRGGVRHIAHHDFGPELLISNIIFGSSASLGHYLRLSQKYPEKYKERRKELLLAYFKNRASTDRNFIRINQSKEALAYVSTMKQKITDSLEGYGYTKDSVDEILASLGLDTREAFSLDTQHQREAPQTDWNMGAGDLYDFLMLQVLDELRKEDPAIAEILAKTPLKRPIVSCPDTAGNVAELVDFKMLHLFQLAGESRYKVHWVYYPQDLEDVYEQVFLPVSEELISHLKTSVDKKTG